MLIIRDNCFVTPSRNRQPQRRNRSRRGHGVIPTLAWTITQTPVPLLWYSSTTVAVCCAFYAAILAEAFLWTRFKLLPSYSHLPFQSRGYILRVSGDRSMNKVQSGHSMRGVLCSTYNTPRRGNVEVSTYSCRRGGRYASAGSYLIFMIHAQLDLDLILISQDELTPPTSLRLHSVFCHLLPPPFILLRPATSLMLPSR